MGKLGRRARPRVRGRGQEREMKWMVWELGSRP